MKQKLLAIGIVLVLAGVTLVATTVYQELVQEPQWPEDYHMQIPTAKYEWHSRNTTITVIGIIFIGLGVGFVLRGRPNAHHS